MIVAVVEMPLHPGSAVEGLAILDEMLVQTREFDGCQGVDVLVGVNDPARVVLVERWSSQEADDAYRVFRNSENPSPLAPHLAAPPIVTHYGIRK